MKHLETEAEIRSRNRRLHAGFRYASIEALIIERPVRRRRKKKAKARLRPQATR